jgi:hypothetical protein
MRDCTNAHRAAVRGGAALALVAMLGLAGCAGSRSGSMDGSDAGYTGRDDRAVRCERDRGIWRPAIAGGYCERKP